MTHHRRTLQRGLVALVLCVQSLPGFGHGDEPHGDAPHDEVAAGASPGAPRFEAVTDVFEMVARIEADALVLYVNRFETGEPIREAKVEVETGAFEAIAEYQADQGSYAVRDAAFLKALSEPGTHAVVTTVTSGQDADLLTASLTVAAAEDEHALAARPFAWAAPAMAGGLAIVAAGAGVLHLRRRRMTTRGDR